MCFTSTSGNFYIAIPGTINDWFTPTVALWNKYYVYIKNILCFIFISENSLIVTSGTDLSWFTSNGTCTLWNILS